MTRFSFDMKISTSSFLPMLATALLGVGPTLLSARFAPGPWTYLSTAGVVCATTAFVAIGLRRTRDLAALEARERTLNSAATSADARSAALEAMMRETASHDETTGVLNRRTFLTRLDEAIHRDARLQKPMALLLIDVDGFKKINSEAGRLVGDRVLRTIGRAIQASTRGTDFVGRVGGDEFAVLLAECIDPRPVVGRVFVALHGETTGGDKSLPLRVSIGTVTVESPHRGIDPAELFRCAEDALASVQSKGGGLCATREYASPTAPSVATT